MLAAPELDDAYYIFAVIDANGKRLVLPFADDRTSCPWRAFTGKVPSAAVFPRLWSLAYVTLDHELNQSAAKLQKAGERATPGILLGYGRDGTVFDRRRPGWVVHVPQYHSEQAHHHATRHGAGTHQAVAQAAAAAVIHAAR